MTDDIALLRKFVAENADDAFRELVQQRIDFVYAAALRQVGGDRHLAEEVAQNVFIDLAGKARGLVARPTLTGWFYTSTRFAAANALRARGRRLHYETAAHTMHEVLSASSSPMVSWDSLRPVLDAALHALREKDREAILLRFFEGRSFSEVGTGIGSGENAARMRVDRALEKLREQLARRGITSTAAALGATLAAQPAIAAPAGLALQSAEAALLAKAAGGGAATLFTLMTTTKKLAVVGIATAVSLGALLYETRESTEALAMPESTARELAALRAENERLRIEAQRAAVGDGKQKSGSDATEPTVNTMSRLRMIDELQRTGLMRRGLSVIDESGIQAPWADVFQLTVGERAAAARAIETADRRLGDYEKANATVEKKDAQTLVITVPPFPEGAAVYDQLMRSMAEILGPERYPLFVSLGMSDLEDRLRQLGVGRRVLTITRDPSPTKAKEGYYIVSQLHRPDGTRRSQTCAVPSLADGLASYMAGSVVQLAPPDF